jgi:predicted dehydrogenase
MKSVKVGVIGTNRQSHLLALKSHERADLVAICGRNPERTAERAQKNTGSVKHMPTIAV